MSHLVPLLKSSHHTHRRYSMDAISLFMLFSFTLMAITEMKL